MSSSSSKNNIKLSIDTKQPDAVDNFDGQQPSSASPNTLVTTASTFSAAETPRNQRIMSPIEREAEAEKFVTEIGLEWADLKAYQKTRAKKIMSPDYTWSPNRGCAKPNRDFIGTTFKKEWDKFVGGLEGELKNAFLNNYDNVFFDEKALTKYMVIHRQLSGTCSSHASATAQHYIASKRRGHNDDEKSANHHEMLDISSYIRFILTPDIQKLYILDGVTGLNSFELLKHITGTKERNYSALRFCRGEKSGIRWLYDRFHDDREPRLVGHFMYCPKQFEKSTVLDDSMDETEYDEVVAKENGKASLHAMVLIGAYKSKDERYWFLLQNSHKDDYFKLITGEYLASCSARISFASTKVDMELQEDYPVTTGEYSEAAGLLEECEWHYEAEG